MARPRIFVLSPPILPPRQLCVDQHFKRQQWACLGLLSEFSNCLKGAEVGKTTLKGEPHVDTGVY